MKLNRIFMGAAVLALAAACSDRDFDPNANGNNDPGQVAGYLAVQINLPQTPDTRGDNDTFDDGTPAEYAVSKVALVLFEGESEATATFKGVQVLNNATFVENTPTTTDNITSSYSTLVELSAAPENDLYALAMVNYTGDILTVGSGSGLVATGCKIGNTDLTSTTKLSDINSIASTADFYTSGTNTDFFMTNAPLYSNNAVQTLAKLSKDKVTKTKEDAQKPENLAGCIYVERALAKVTARNSADSFLKFFDEDGNLIGASKADDGTISKTAAYPTVAVSVKYALTNTNSTSYIVRNTDIPATVNSISGAFDWSWQTTSANKYRMVGTTNMNALGDPFHTSVPDAALYRTYWCKDPNYDTNSTDQTPNPLTQLTAASAAFSELTAASYPGENTFSVDKMTYGNTTIAIFEVTYTVTNGSEKASNLYTRNGIKDAVYLSAGAAMAPAVNYILNNEGFKKCLTSNPATEGAAVATDNLASFVEFDFKTDNTDNSVTVNDVKLTDTGKASIDETKFNAAYAEIKTILLQSANSLCDATEYTDGKTYYYIPIEHFGDTYCPLADGYTGTAPAAVYGTSGSINADSFKNYLGRYGMVRNNWYDLNITELTGLGDATFPEIPWAWADDNNEEKNFFRMEIHILSWAKRTQAIKF